MRAEEEEVEEEEEEEEEKEVEEEEPRFRTKSASLSYSKLTVAMADDIASVRAERGLVVSVASFCWVRTPPQSPSNQLTINHNLSCVSAAEKYKQKP